MSIKLNNSTNFHFLCFFMSIKHITYVIRHFLLLFLTINILKYLLVELKIVDIQAYIVCINPTSSFNKICRLIFILKR